MNATRVVSAVVLLAMGLVIVAGGVSALAYGIVLAGSQCPACPIDRGAQWPLYAGLGSGLVTAALVHFVTAYGVWRGRGWAEWVALAVAGIGFAIAVALGLGELNPMGRTADPAGVLRPVFFPERLLAEAAVAAAYAFVFVGGLRRRVTRQSV